MVDMAKPSISPMLSVRNGAKAVEFYKAAFGAGELFRLDAEDGSVVARLSVDLNSGWRTSLRSTRISAPSRWALSFGEVPRYGW